MNNTLSVRQVGAAQARPYFSTLAQTVGGAMDSLARLCWLLDYLVAERRYWGKR